jgi:hypothetical protein
MWIYIQLGIAVVALDLLDRNQVQSRRPSIERVNLNECLSTFTFMYILNHIMSIISSEGTTRRLRRRWMQTPNCMKIRRMGVVDIHRKQHEKRHYKFEARHDLDRYCAGFASVDGYQAGLNRVAFGCNAFCNPHGWDEGDKWCDGSATRRASRCPKDTERETQPCLCHLESRRWYQW